MCDEYYRVVGREMKSDIIILFVLCLVMEEMEKGKVRRISIWIHLIFPSMCRKRIKRQRGSQFILNWYFFPTHFPF
jgi:hypothetical protein